MNTEKKQRNGAIVEEVEICNCTNTQLERGETCGLQICPNASQSAMHPRLDEGGEPFAAVPTEEGRSDDTALVLLAAHPDFNRDAFAWIGSEHLGGGVFSASIYTGTAPDSPYLWVTRGEEDPEKFLACVYVASAEGEEPEDPFLVAESGAEDLAVEALRMLDSAKSLGRRRAGER
jgi:hypothetical protein